MFKHVPGTGNTLLIASDRLGNVLLSAPFSGSVDLGGGPLASAGALDAFVAKLAL